MGGRGSNVSTANLRRREDEKRGAILEASPLTLEAGGKTVKLENSRPSLSNVPSGKASHCKGNHGGEMWNFLSLSMAAGGPTSAIFTRLCLLLPFSYFFFRFCFGYYRLSLLVQTEERESTFFSRCSTID